MESDEAHAEIQRRKKRAVDLRIRELLYSLYFSHFKRYEDWLREDTQLVYPGVRESIKIGAKDIHFSIGHTSYQLSFREGPSREGEPLRDGTHGDGVEEQIIPETLALRVNNQRVFKFDICRRTFYSRASIDGDESLGEVTRFIEGPWVSEITDLYQKISAHEVVIHKIRNAPAEARKLEILKKRFGL